MQPVPHTAAGETLSVDVLVVSPTCWMLSGRFAPMHKTAGYLPVLCSILICSAKWQIAHYSCLCCFIFAAVMVSVFSVADERENVWRGL